jgi:hypothetical protein
MTIHELDQLLREKDFPCVTIILPLEKNHTHNAVLLKKAIQEVHKLLDRETVPQKSRSRAKFRIDEVIREAPLKGSDGLGIYISPEKSAAVQFPFAVTRKVFVGHNFEKRDLLYLRQYMVPYLVLGLQKKSVRLFNGLMDELEEVETHRFPMLIEEEYEYSRPSGSNRAGTTLKAFEKDKSIISAIRLQNNFREAAEEIRHYLAGRDIPVILAGTRELIMHFIQVSDLTRYIAGTVEGNYIETDERRLGRDSWNMIIGYKRLEATRVLEKINEQRAGNVARGIQDVWRAAHEGKGLLLLVEKDYHIRGYQPLQKTELYLNPPQTPHTVIEDAVSELIDTVNTKDGKVMFTDNEQLENMDHLALLLRFGSIYHQN